METDVDVEILVQPLITAIKKAIVRETENTTSK